MNAPYDIVLTHGKIVDGCGNPWFWGDLAIRRGRIAQIAPPGTLRGKTTLDANGRFIAPGFVDVHTHSDLAILVNRRAESVVRQGVMCHHRRQRLCRLPQRRLAECALDWPCQKAPSRLTFEI